MGVSAAEGTSEKNRLEWRKRGGDKRAERGRGRERETGGEKTTGNQTILMLFLHISSHNSAEYHEEQSRHVFSRLISWGTSHVKRVEVWKVTSAPTVWSVRVRADAGVWELCAGILVRLPFDLPSQFCFWGSYGSILVVSGNVLFQSSGLLTGAHMKNKGNKQKTKKKGSENVFGCDLTEHLQGSGQDGNACFEI